MSGSETQGQFDEDGREILEPCPKCGTTSVNCPLSSRQKCPYDEQEADRA